VFEPSNEEVKEALGILGMNYNSFQCAYCGAAASEWDHLRPLVINKKPTGYVSEIQNLVPACGKCNQSKGNRPWDTWIVSPAKLSPKSRGIQDLEPRVFRLWDYEKWREPTVVDFEAAVGRFKWRRHWANWELVQNTMRQAQELASEINKEIAEAYTKP